MISALTNGILFNAPEQRTSKTGKPFVAATIKIQDDTSNFVKVLAFSDSTQAELVRLQDGDSLSVQGLLKCETYETNGEHRISLCIVASHVLALRQPPKPKDTAPPDTRSKQERQRGAWSSPDDGPNDDFSF